MGNLSRHSPSPGPSALPRLAVFFTLCTGPLACQGKDPEALYLAGDYLAARDYYQPKRCASLSGEEKNHCDARALEIEQALAGAVRYLGRRANDATRRRESIQFNQYDEAVRCLRLALKILGKDDPARQEYDEGLQRILSTTAALETEYEEQLIKIEELLNSGTYNPDVWRDIRLSFERVRVLRLALAKADQRPWELAQRFVKKFRRHGQYEHAYLAAQMALAVEDRGESHRSKRQLTERDLVLFGVLEMRAEAQQHERQQRISALVQQVESLEREGQMRTAAQTAKQALALAPSPKTSRRLRKFLEKVDGVAFKEATKIVREVKEVIPDPAAVTPVEVELAQSGVAADAPMKTVSEPDADQNDPLQPTTSLNLGPKTKANLLRTLSALAAQLKRGENYEALTGLEDVVVYYEGSPHQERAKKLQQAWAPKRHDLIDELVREADKLFIHMDERSYEVYLQAQKLRPQGTAARHIHERVATLERIIK